MLCRTACQQGVEIQHFDWLAIDEKAPRNMGAGVVTGFLYFGGNQVRTRRSRESRCPQGLQENCGARSGKSGETDELLPSNMLATS